MKSFKLACLFSLVFLSVMAPEQSFAKKKGGKDAGKPIEFAVSPPAFDLKCVPGEKKTLTVKASNPMGINGSLSLSPVGYVLAGGDAPIEKPLASLPSNSLARHIIIESAVVPIAAHSSKEISLTLDVPQGLVGTQYAGVSISNTLDVNLVDEVDRPEEYTKKIGVGFYVGLGIKIKCQMEGSVSYTYQLEKMQFVPAQGNEPATVKVTLKNTGNGEMQFMPMIVLMDANKKAVARLKGTSVVTLVPGATQTVEVAPSFTSIPPGTYQAILTLASAELQLKPSEQKLVVSR